MPEENPENPANSAGTLAIDRGYFLVNRFAPADYVVEVTNIPVGVTGPIIGKRVECGEEGTVVLDPNVKPKAEVISAKSDILFSGLAKGSYVAEFMVQGAKLLENPVITTHSFTVYDKPGPAQGGNGNVIVDTYTFLDIFNGTPPPVGPVPPPAPPVEIPEQDVRQYRLSPLFDFSLSSATRTGSDFTLQGKGPPHTHPNCVAVMLRLYRIEPNGNFTVVGETLCRGLWHTWRLVWTVFDTFNPVTFVLGGGPTGDKSITKNF